MTMHKCTYTDKIINENGNLIRIVTAYCNNKTYENSMDVVREDENLMNFCRNVVYSRMTGYGVIFPDEKAYNFNSNSIYGEDDWGETLGGKKEGEKELPLYCKNKASCSDKNIIRAKYPNFYEVLKTYNFEYNSHLIKALYYWKQDSKNFIFLISKKLFQTAFNSKYYQMNDIQKGQFNDFVSKNKVYDYPFCRIQNIMKLKKLFPALSVQTIYNFNYSQVSNKNKILSFFKITDEYKSLSVSKQNEFDSFYLKDNTWYTQYYSYPKFKRLVKSIKKYPKISISILNDIVSNCVSTEDYSSFLVTYNPSFKYTLKKANKITRLEDLKEVFSLWKNHPQEVEALLYAKLDTVARNTEYYKKDSDFKKKTIRFINKAIKNNITKLEYVRISDLEVLYTFDFENFSKEEILTVLNNSYQTKNLDEKQIRYITSNDIAPDEYSDYISYCQKVGHDIKENYWRFPKNFEEKLIKVIEEKKNLDKYKKENEASLYFNAVQKYIKNNPKLKIDDYEIYIPETIEDIKYQADVLSQCLIRCDYPMKVIDNKSVLVFLRLDGQPVATCELSENQIVQFRQKANADVTADMQNAMNKWLEKSTLAA